jgi:hypothetical protein
VIKPVQSGDRVLRLSYAWRQPRNASDSGRALTWWLERLQHPTTRNALLSQHHQS